MNIEIRKPRVRPLALCTVLAMIGLLAALVPAHGAVSPRATAAAPALVAPVNTYASFPVGISGGEPSIGFDPIRNVAMYGSGLHVRRLTWNDSVSPPGYTSVDVTPDTAVTTLDAIVETDADTGRTFNSQLDGVCSLASFTDDAGATWTPSQGCGENTVLDHQSVGTGPFHAPIPAPPPPAYQHAVYYCAQNGFNGACAVSLNGGLTFGPGVYTHNTPANDPNDPNPIFAAEGGACSALHGHLIVGPDGTAYLPLKGCGGQPSTNNGTNTEYVDGTASLSISADNGATWLIHRVPVSQVPNGLGGTNVVQNPDESDSTLSISRPTAAHPGGVLYYAWENGVNPTDLKNGDYTQAMVATSTDNGNTWSAPTDISSFIGLNNVMFPEVIAGNANRAAVAFLGTTAIGDDQTNAFPKGTWDLYISTTNDGGQTWSTPVDTTPNDPVQRGCIDMQGITIPPSGRLDVCTQRNLLDFNDITVDKEGRVLAAYADGCNTACANNPNSGSSGAVNLVMRTATGPGLFANPTTTTLACVPNPVVSAATTSCTATVTDTGSVAAGDSPTSKPAGTVSFTKSGSGSFGSTTCSLSPSATAGVSTCSVNYTPSAPGAQTITASYGGELKHDPSVGSTSLDVNSGISCPGFAGDPRNQIVGTAGNDTLTGTDGPDIICGLAGDDLIRGLGGDDVLLGNGGNDRMYGGTGNDTFDGGTATDTVLFSELPVASAVTANLTTGTSTNAQLGTDIFIQLSGLSTVENLSGTKYDDVFTGDAGPNQLSGAGGNDTLTGNGGNDYLIGADGTDTMSGGAGKDLIQPGIGNDLSVDGGSESDTISYADVTTGGGVTVTLTGGGAGTATGGSGSDSFTTMEVEIGSPQADVMTGDTGANTMSGLAGADTISGSDGNDVLSGGAGNDSITGGNGVDTVTYQTDPAGITANLGTGTVTDGYGNTDTLSGMESLIGSNTGADNITGSAAVDHLWGFGGNDSISALDANDYLNGGAGTDALDGGNGTDTCVNGETLTSCEQTSSPALGAAYRSNLSRASDLARAERRMGKVQ